MDSDSLIDQYMMMLKQIPLRTHAGKEKPQCNEMYLVYIFPFGEFWSVNLNLSVKWGGKRLKRICIRRSFPFHERLIAG